MMYSTEKIQEKILLKRIIRIVPTYYFFSILMFILLAINPSLSLMSSAKVDYLINTLLFIPYISYGISGGGGINPLIGAAWTLNLEIYFYILFAFCNKVSHKKRGLLTSVFLIIIFLCGINSTNLIVKYLTNSVILEFILGIISYYFYSMFKNKIIESKKIKNSLYLIIIICLTILIILNKYNIVNFRIIKYGILSMIIFNCILYALDNVKIPKIFITLGNISFSFYLIEFFVAAAMNVIYNFFNINNVIFNIFLMIISVGITSILSYFSWYFLEIKLSNYIKKLPSKIKLKKEIDFI